MKCFDLISPFFTFSVIVSSLWSSTSGETILGKIMCNADGLKKADCQGKDMPEESFPKECTSFFYAGVYVYINGTIEDPNISQHPPGYLEKIGAHGKPVILMVVRLPWFECLQAMKKDKTIMETEIAGWKDYLGKHSSISAMAIYKSEVNSNETADANYTSNMIEWIDTMKKNFPKLEFGMYVSIGTMSSTNDELKGIDLQKLDASLCFYLMQSTTALSVLECNTPDAKYGDVIMNECNQVAQDYFTKMSIKKDKMIWNILGKPVNMQMSDCELSVDQMCAKPNGTYCLNTLKDFFEKGKFFKDNSGGVALLNIDYDDANEVCQCGKFPIFYALYNGITGGAEPKPCPLIDRPEGLGIAVCDTFASFKSKCKTEDISPECFPPECTSFFYSGLDLSNGTVVEMDLDEIPEGYLDSLLALKKPVTVLLSRDSWNKAVKCVQQDGAETEVAMLKTFLDKHKGITGLALFRLELFAEDEEYPEYTQNLITYIGILRKNFPQMKIGLYLNNGMIINTLDTPQLKSLDLACLDQNVDFFRMLSASDLLAAECASPDFVHGDVVLNEYNKLVVDYISGLNLTKEKIVWDIWGSPTNANLEPCDLTYTNAKHIKEIAGGFALNYIDIDDVNCGCQCDRPFPVFYALWDGINGNSEPKECCLMDRPDL